MEIINWSNYSPQEFQLFCSALLSFEFGKSFSPFTAPGKDYGVDGAFEGEYNGKSGKWRFQYKFHSVARKNGFQLLKSSLPAELAKLGSEEHFILLTNVELLPQEAKELHTIFVYHANTHSKSTFEIWDGAKLYTLYLNHPILELWLREGFATAQLVDYRTHFKAALNSADPDPANLGNFFVSRREEIDKLSLFLASSELLALITGEAGIGKTRLVIEFFKETEDKGQEWQKLVLQNKAVDFDKLRRALSGDKRFIIFVDDAHLYDPSVVSDIRSIAGQLEGTTKVILTARALEAYNSLRLIREYERQQILKIPLDSLSPNDAAQIFKYELQGSPFEHENAELVRISHGKPLMIMAILKAIRSGTTITSIKEETFIKEYVESYFDSLVFQVAKESNASKLQLRKLLHFITLIEPFAYTDAAVVNKLSVASDLDVETVSYTLKIMQDAGISKGKFEQSIRPDFYSDILLKHADTSSIVQQIPNLIGYIDHIIINLSSVDEGQANPSALLDFILGKYVESIGNEKGDITRLTQVISTIASITYQKPGIAKQAVKLVLKAINNPEHVIHEDLQSNKHYYFQSLESIAGQVKRILFDLLYFPSYYRFVFDALLAIHRLLPETQAEKLVLSFSTRDNWEKFTFKRQLFVVDSFHKLIKKLSVGEQLFAVSCCRMFLKLEFTSTTATDPAGRAITITTFFLPSSASVKRLRERGMSLLFDLYKSSGSDEVKAAAFHEILDLPRGIFATKRTPNVYNGDSEIAQVLDFLMEVASDMQASYQKEVLDKIFWYRKWGIDVSFNEKLRALETELEPKTVTQQVIHLLAKSELGFFDLRKTENLEMAQDVIGKADTSELGHGLLELLGGDNNRIHYLFPFISVIYTDFPEKAKRIYEIWWSENPSLVFQYGAPFLQVLRFKHQDNNFFWTKTEELQRTNTESADSLILRCYSHYLFKKGDLTERDITVIEQIAQKAKASNHLDLARALHAVFQVNENKGAEIAIPFLARCSQREADIFFVFLGEDGFPSYTLIRKLILEHSIRFSITYEVEQCLNKIVRQERAAPLFEYLVKRFEHMNRVITETNSMLQYDWVPHADHSHVFENCPDETIHELFVLGIRWYIAIDLDAIQHFLSKRFLEFIAYTETLTQSMEETIEPLIDEYLDRELSLKRVLDVLEVFKQKDDRLVELILRTHTKIYLRYSDDDELLRDFQSLCYLGLTATGVKSGTAGEPFQVDLDLRDLLHRQLRNTQDTDPNFDFLQRVIRSLDKTIQRDTDTLDEIW